MWQYAVPCRLFSGSAHLGSCRFTWSETVGNVGAERAAGGVHHCSWSSTITRRASVSVLRGVDLLPSALARLHLHLRWTTRQQSGLCQYAPADFLSLACLVNLAAGWLASMLAIGWKASSSCRIIGAERRRAATTTECEFRRLDA